MTPSINGIALLAPGERLDPETLRERAWGELLRQEAVRQGLLPAVDATVAPTLDEREEAVIHRLLDEQVPLRQPTANAAPSNVWTMPSMMNGTRMNQFVAPTSFITSISLRRANVATRMVLRMSMKAATSRSMDAIRKRTPILLNVSWMRLTTSKANTTS